MKKLFYAACTALVTACSSAPKKDVKTFVSEGNPIIAENFTADPAPMVYDGTLYLYVEQTK